MADDGERAGLSGLREKIDEIDDRLLGALADRRGVSRAVIANKMSQASDLRDTSREKELLVDRIERGAKLGLDAPYVTRVFHQVIDDSVRLQQELLQAHVNDDGSDAAPIRVAHLGAEGSFSHGAARGHFARRGPKPITVSAPTFQEVITAVETGRADFGMLPIENTTSGGINEVYDLLLHTRLSIVGEHRARIVHCLLGNEGASLDDVRTVYSHPQPFEQCSVFLRRMREATYMATADTATAVEEVAAAGDPSAAAIGSEAAAQLYGLRVLASEIANHTENYTRFLVVGPRPVEVDARVPAKTSLVLSTSQRPGSLVEVLLVFRNHQINLTKLESRPILGNPWQEMFYIDVQANIAERRMEKALVELEAHTRQVRVLGTYPSDELKPTPVDE